MSESKRCKQSSLKIGPYTALHVWLTIFIAVVVFIERLIEQNMATEVDEIMEDVEIEVPEAVVGEKREGSLLEEPGTKYRKVERECRSEFERDIPEYTRLWHKEYYPWCYETRRLLTDPPDINNRLIMVRRQEHLDLLLMPGMHHFKE